MRAQHLLVVPRGHFAAALQLLMQRGHFAAALQLLMQRRRFAAALQLLMQRRRFAAALQLLMQRRRFAAALPLLLCAALVGCGASLPRPAQPFVDPAQALSFHQLARERVRSIRAEARVDQRGAEGRIKGTVLMFVQRPDRVRFDAMTQFGPAAILTSEGERFSYSDLRKRRFITGPTCPQNIARMLNLPLSVDQTTALLLGGTPVIEHDSQQIGWNSGGFYRVALHARDGRRQEVDLGVSDRDAKLPPSRQELRLLRSEIYDRTGKSSFSAVYEDYRMVSAGSYHIAMPFEVRVQQAQTASDTVIRFKQIAINVDVPEGAFTQESPPGMEQEEATCD